MNAAAVRARPITLQARRAVLEAAVLAAIALLDDMDGDADLEECEDEGAQCEGESECWDDACPNFTLHDQTRLGTYAGDPVVVLDPDDDPGEFVVQVEVGLAR